MKSFTILIQFLVCFVLCTAALLAQTDTTVTITNEGNVGIGITAPEARLHVAGLAQFDKVGPEGRLILKSMKYNDQGRMGIRFLNNQIATFEGDDQGDITFAFYSGWGYTREHNASISVHGKATNNWGKYLQLTHDGTDGMVATDAGNILIDPAKGKGNVGIGVADPATKLEVSDILRVRGNAWPGTGKGMELAYSPDQHRGFIQVFDRDKNQWGSLYLGNGKVGIGIENPASKLTVNGTIESKAGGIKFPDGSVQTTASAGSGGSAIFKQVTVNTSVSSTFADKASISITPGNAGGYFVLTFSGMATNLTASNEARISIYLTNTPNTGSSYPGYVTYWQDSDSGYMRQVPMHTTRVFDNADANAKTFYLRAGDLFNGGYTIYGAFIVQWIPGS